MRKKRNIEKEKLQRDFYKYLSKSKNHKIFLLGAHSYIFGRFMFGINQMSINNSVKSNVKDFVFWGSSSGTKSGDLSFRVE